MRKKISIFMLISLLSSHAFSLGNSGPLKNAWTVLSLGFSALIGRGDQQLFDTLQRLYIEITTAENSTIVQQERRFTELTAAHQRYLDFVHAHGGNDRATGPIDAQQLVTAARTHLEQQIHSEQQLLEQLQRLHDFIMNPENTLESQQGVLHAMEQVFENYKGSQTEKANRLMQEAQNSVNSKTGK